MEIAGAAPTGAGLRLPRDLAGERPEEARPGRRRRIARVPDRALAPPDRSLAPSDGPLAPPDAGDPDRRPAAALAGAVRARRCLALAALALLAGCAPERPPAVVRVTYACDAGRGFVARYERPGEVILELDDRSRVLPEVAAIAGTRYDDGTHELRLEGRTATLRGPGATYSNCVARDWQDAGPG